MAKSCEITNTDVLLLHNALSTYTEAEKNDVPQKTTEHREQLLNELAQLFSTSPTTFTLEQKKESEEQQGVTTMTTIPDWLFERTDLTFEQKWLSMALVMLIESIPNKEYQTYAATIEEIEQDTHHQGPLDPLSLFDLADKRLIRLTQTGEEYAIAIAKR